MQSIPPYLWPSGGGRWGGGENHHGSNNIWDDDILRHPNSKNRATRNQTDYILLPAKWKLWVTNSKTIPGDDCNTDHSLLMAVLRLDFKRNKWILLLWLNLDKRPQGFEVIINGMPLWNVAISMIHCQFILSCAMKRA